MTLVTAVPEPEEWLLQVAGIAMLRVLWRIVACEKLVRRQGFTGDVF